MKHDNKSTGLFSDEEEDYNLEEETKYKLKLDTPKSEPAFSASDDEDSLDAFADAEGDEEVDLSFGDEKEDNGDNEKPFDDEPFDAGVEADEDEDPEKFIQQLAGKLGTSLRKYNDERGEPDFDLEKYAINSVISATHTAEMDEEDQKDIIKKIKMSGAGDENDDIDKDIDVDMDVDKDVDAEEPSFDNEVGADDEEGFGDELEENEMMIQNLKNMKDDAEDILSLGDDELNKKLKGHEWAPDHISTSADDTEEVADFLTTEDENPCWDGYEMVGMKEKGGKEVPNCVPVNETITEAEYKGKKVTLNKPQSCSNDSTCKKKYKVHVKNDKGNVIRVQFGDPNMEIRRDNAEARKNFRARHNCAEKKDKTTAGYWSCKMWSKKSVSDILNESEKNSIFVEKLNMKEIIIAKLHETVQPSIKPDVKPTVVPEEKPIRERRIWQPKTKPKTKPKMEENVDVMMLNGKEVDSTSLEIEGVDSRDYPDFTDAYFSYGLFSDGTEMSDEELDQLSDEYPEVLNEKAYESLI